MARMIPRVDPDTIGNKGERLAYRLFRDKLPNDWVVRWDYNFCVKVDFRLKEGQVDFIIIAPHKGVLFVEVKGSKGLRLDANNEEVGFRIAKNGSEEKLAKTPFTQVSEHKHNVVEQILCERLGVKNKDFPGIYAHAVFYPQGKLVNTPPSQTTQVFWGYVDNENLEQKAVAAFRNVANLEYGKKFTIGVKEKIVEIFEDHSFVPVAQAAESDDFNSQISRLTTNQFNTVRGLLQSNLKRALVKGQAGSGKTMLALWTAGHFATNGLRTLFLCKNKALQTWIAKSYSKAPFDVYTFQGLCPKLDKKWIKHDKSGQDFWDQEVPTIITDVAADLPESERYDAIVIDEGQDFHPHWFIPVEMLLKDEKEDKLFIFCDPEQQVQYDGKLRFPDVDIEYPLVANCRNPEKINDYCGNVIRKDLQSMEGMPKGSNPRVMKATSDARQRASICLNLVKDWLEEGFKPSRIVVLSPHSSRNESSSLYYLDKKSFHNKQFTDDPKNLESWLNDQSFWMSTITKFKGLEADCVILTDIPSSDSYFSDNDFYVGTSRAKHQVVIIPCDTRAEVRAKKYLGSV